MSVKYPCIYYDDGKCKLFSGEPSISFCVFGPCEYEKPSNADRIRAALEELEQQETPEEIAALRGQLARANEDQRRRDLMRMEDGNESKDM